jgi:hypothetical protein
MRQQYRLNTKYRDFLESLNNWYLALYEISSDDPSQFIAIFTLSSYALINICIYVYFKNLSNISENEVIIIEMINYLNRYKDSQKICKNDKLKIACKEKDLYNSFFIESQSSIEIRPQVITCIELFLDLLPDMITNNIKFDINSIGTYKECGSYLDDVELEKDSSVWHIVIFPSLEVVECRKCCLKTPTTIRKSRGQKAPLEQASLETNKSIEEYMTYISMLTEQGLQIYNLEIYDLNKRDLRQLIQTQGTIQQQLRIPSVPQRSSTLAGIQQLKIQDRVPISLSSIFDDVAQPYKVPEIQQSQVLSKQQIKQLKISFKQQLEQLKGLFIQKLEQIPEKLEDIKNLSRQIIQSLVDRRLDILKDYKKFIHLIRYEDPWFETIAAAHSFFPNKADIANLYEIFLRQGLKQWLDSTYDDDKPNFMNDWIKSAQFLVRICEMVYKYIFIFYILENHESMTHQLTQSKDIKDQKFIIQQFYFMIGLVLRTNDKKDQRFVSRNKTSRAEVLFSKEIISDLIEEILHIIFDPSQSESDVSTLRYIFYNDSVLKEEVKQVIKEGIWLVAALGLSIPVIKINWLSIGNQVTFDDRSHIDIEGRSRKGRKKIIFPSLYIENKGYDPISHALVETITQSDKK